jgi:hypothetical protein
MQIVQDRVEQAMQAMFPHGAGRVSHTQVRHHLEQIAEIAFQAGKHEALMGLMTASDVAAHFDVSERRARALIRNRHERFGTGMQVGNTWLVHRDELETLEPEAKYRADA